MKPSVLRTLLFASLAFGLTIGVIFPFFADLFVTWKPGMYGWFFASALLAGLLVGGANYWFVNLILVSRLRRIAEVATSVSERNLNHHCAMQSDDTVGEIVDAFNKMAGNLRDLIGQIGGMSGQVERDARDIQQQIDQIRSRFSAQHENSQQISRSMDRMSGTVSDIAGTAQEVAESSRNAVNSARAGTSVVAETISGMSSIQQIVGQAVGDVHQLGQRSDEIGAIVAVIRGIADQTNLLALNAAIEAARAGEQGRGFAVVADEVRKLAEKTGSATGEISQMIAAIQQQVGQSVRTMEQSQNEVAAGVDRAEKAGAALADILADIENASAMMERIAAGAADQRSVVGEIGHQVDAIDSGIEAVLISTHDTERSCRQLADQSAALHREVGRFKLA